MLPRREIVLSAPAIPAVAAVPPGGANPPSRIAQIVGRLEQLAVDRDELFHLHAEPLGSALTATSPAYVAEAAAIDAESARLMRQLIKSSARTRSDMELKAKVVGQHIVFPSARYMGPADALLRSLLVDLGVVA